MLAKYQYFWYFSSFVIFQTSPLFKYLKFILEKYCYFSCIDAGKVMIPQKYQYMKSIHTWKLLTLENYWHLKISDTWLKSIDTWKVLIHKKHWFLKLLIFLVTTSKVLTLLILEKYWCFWYWKRIDSFDIWNFLTLSKLENMKNPLSL